jgi:hypothetical protein
MRCSAPSCMTAWMVISWTTLARLSTTQTGAILVLELSPSRECVADELVDLDPYSCCIRVHGAGYCIEML